MVLPDEADERGPGEVAFLRESPRRGALEVEQLRPGRDDGDARHLVVEVPDAGFERRPGGRIDGPPARLEVAVGDAVDNLHLGGAAHQQAARRRAADVDRHRDARIVAQRCHLRELGTVQRMIFVSRTR